MLFGSYDDGRVSGAVSMTAPYELLLAVMPDGSVEELAAELHARAVSVSGVHGEAGVVERFAAAWIAGTSLRAATTLHLRLYALAALCPPTPLPTGRARPARGEDFDIAVRCLTAFHADTAAPPLTSRRTCETESTMDCCGCGRTPPARSSRWLGAARPRRVWHVWLRCTHHRRTVGVTMAPQSPLPARVTRFAAVHNRSCCSPTSPTPRPMRSTTNRIPTDQRPHHREVPAVTKSG